MQNTLSKPLTPTELRANLYRVLDEVLASGEPCRVSRNGQTLVIRRERTRRKRRDLSKLKRRPDIFKGTFDELVAISWEKEWKPFLDDEK